MFIYIGFILAGVSVVSLGVIFYLTYRDPRWRVFNFHSRLATEAEIYNVSENPVISKVRQMDEHTLRLEFLPPVQTTSWEIEAVNSGVVKKSRYPDLNFPELSPVTETFKLTPQGQLFDRPLEITIQFYPAEKYAEAGLSWPDNYFTPSTTLRFSTRQPFSTRVWSGISQSDIDMLHARSILEDQINFSSSTLDKLTAIFKLVMQDTIGAAGTPDDEMQSASPIQTYERMKTGRGKGWCENISIIYYLFANAAEIPTRLVDIAGKFGPLKLTGHYVCESWIPEHSTWCYVDPQSRVAYVTTPEGMLLHTLDLKRLADLGMLEPCRIKYYDAEENELLDRDAHAFSQAIAGYLHGDLVLAYKFGYAKNISYSRLKNFLFYPTLLYATYPIPRLFYLKKSLFIFVILFSLISLLAGLWRLIDIPIGQMFK